MTDLITEARKLCAAATPGPWESGNYGAVCLKSGFKLGNIEGSGNADFIARSRTIIPELCDALEKAEQQIPRWIPVEERLPKTEKPVQVYMPKLHMSVQTGFYTKYYGEDDGEWYEHWVASGDVTHWRPLPAPPEK